MALTALRVSEYEYGRSKHRERQLHSSRLYARMALRCAAQSLVTGEMTCLLDANGAHTLRVRDFGGAGTGNYSLYVQRLNNPVGCTPIAFGATLSSSISVAAEVDCFTFTGAPTSPG